MTLSGPMILGLLGAALAAWQWFSGKPAAPVVALPDHGPGVNHSSPAAVSFVEATAALDRVLGYLRDTGRYGPDQAAAARVLRAATVEAATPAVRDLRNANDGSNHPVIPPGSAETRA